MRNISIFTFFIFLLPLLASCAEPQVYIVYFGDHSGGIPSQEIHDTHHSYLLSVKSSHEDAKSSLIYSYKNSINGFAALLTPDEATKISGMDGVRSVFPSHPNKYSLHTTRSWEFVGLEEGKRGGKHLKRRGGLLQEAEYGQNIIVGLLDSGIWPESKSFSDEGLGPVPKSWKGICQEGPDFNSSHCNRKLIGARYYLKGYEAYYGPLNTTIDYPSPRDHDGHGTHTSSILGGRTVTDVSALGGFAQGTASGGAPLVRLAMYKVCWATPGQDPAAGNTCFETDMLAAIDDALADGVDVLSISIGTHKPYPYMEDGIAIGALHAAKKNVVVACSAGNEGPAPATASNLVPWILTVAASSLDRTFPSPVILGNHMFVEGQTVTPYKLKRMSYSLAYAGSIENPGTAKNASGQCLPGSLSPHKAKGKIVMCMRGAGTRVGKGMEVKRAGGAAMILGNSPVNGDELSVDAHVLPATAVVAKNAIKILKYIKSTKYPEASIVPGETLLNTKPAPSMAAFSSTGPNALEPNILKPDITGPGLNILAAWSEVSAPSKLLADHRVVKYNILSGTSMSCPHVGAVAALLKAIHPTWSAAAIRSALMTTAGLRNNLGTPLTDASGKLANPFNFGSGHLRPTKAADPGLVYDASYTDYLLFLCTSGVKNFDPSFKCPKVSPSPSNLNYPSLTIAKINGTVTVKRTVTNVGGGKSLYFAHVRPPAGYSVKIWPRILHFTHAGEKKSFTIKVTAKKGMKDEYAFGLYTWTDGIHTVRSPMVFSSA